MAIINDMRKYNEGTKGNRGGGRKKEYKVLRSLTTTIEPEVLILIKKKFGKVADALRFCAAPGNHIAKELERISNKYGVNQVSIELTDGRVTAYEVEKDGSLKFLEVIN